MFRDGVFTRPAGPFKPRSLPGWRRGAALSQLPPRVGAADSQQDGGAPTLGHGYEFRCPTAGCTHVHRVLAKPVPGKDSRGHRRWPTARCPLCSLRPSVAGGTCVRCSREVRLCTCRGGVADVGPSPHAPVSAPFAGGSVQPRPTGRIFGAPPPRPSVGGVRPRGRAHDSTVQTSLRQFFRPHATASQGPVLTLGTDFSGMDAPAFALHNLGVRSECKLASENNSHAPAHICVHSNRESFTSSPCWLTLD